MVPSSLGDQAPFGVDATGFQPDQREDLYLGYIVDDDGTWLQAISKKTSLTCHMAGYRTYSLPVYIPSLPCKLQTPAPSKASDFGPSGTFIIFGLSISGRKASMPAEEHAAPQPKLLSWIFPRSEGRRLLTIGSDRIADGPAKHLEVCSSRGTTRLPWTSHDQLDSGTEPRSHKGRAPRPAWIWPVPIQPHKAGAPGNPAGFVCWVGQYHPHLDCFIWEVAKSPSIICGHRAAECRIIGISSQSQPPSWTTNHLSHVWATQKRVRGSHVCRRSHAELATKSVFPRRFASYRGLKGYGYNHCTTPNMALGREHVVFQTFVCVSIIYLG